jgi:hypothetical protein
MLDAWEITIMDRRPQNETEGLERNQMLDEKVFQLKAELRKVTKGDLLRMVLNQTEKNCLLGGVCPFLLEYQHILFCVSEILGQGCQAERQRADSVQEVQSEGESSQKPMEVPVKGG